MDNCVIMKYDIKLRPHHVKAFLNFESKKLFLLSDEEYLNKFQKKNEGYHNVKFILFWKKFLQNLHINSELIFLYTNNYDTICDSCDIKNECNVEATELHELVYSLDQKALEELPLKDGEVYTVKYLKELMPQN